MVQIHSQRYILYYYHLLTPVLTSLLTFVFRCYAYNELSRLLKKLLFNYYAWLVKESFCLLSLLYGAKDRKRTNSCSYQSIHSFTSMQRKGGVGFRLVYIAAYLFPQNDQHFCKKGPCTLLMSMDKVIIT